MIPLTTTGNEVPVMAKHVFSRNDIQSLAKRLEDRAWSPLLVDMPELQKDIRSAAVVLHHMVLVLGVPVTPIEIENSK
jgi:hypothetical protein